jgi:hypothetical protein
VQGLTSTSPVRPPPVRPAVHQPLQVRPRRAGANPTVTGPPPPCCRRCCTHHYHPAVICTVRLGLLGRCPAGGPITLFVSWACTGSLAAGDCDGLGDTGPDAVRLPSSESPPSRASGPFKLGPGDLRASLMSVGPCARSASQPHAGPSWPGAGPRLRGRCGASTGASSAAAARLGVINGRTGRWQLGGQEPCRIGD